MKYHLAGKVVLISGGSKGLGLAMAREFGASGARVVIAARDPAELSQAADWLSTQGIRAGVRVCDFKQNEAVTALVADLEAKLGPVDVLVNNAGVIQIGPTASVTIEDFEETMQTMFWGVVYATTAVLNGMKHRGSGRIVNITSIGGKVSVPHLLPYSTAKFAAVGYSEGLRAGLSNTGVGVITVVPGLMRTGSFLNAQFKGDAAEEYAWFGVGASLPGISIGAAAAARRILRATVHNEPELILSTPANLIARVHGIAPGLTMQMFSLVNRLLPKGASHKLRTGRDVARESDSKALRTAMQLGHKAARDLQHTGV